MAASRTVILTGATGFLGSHLARRWVADGYRVVVLARDPAHLRRIGDLPVLARPAATDLDALLADQAPLHAVVHCATCYGRGSESDATIFDINLAFPVKLLDATARAGVPLFLNTDTTLPAEINAYSLSKAQFRAWGQYIARRSHTRFVNVRLEHFFGPGDDDSKFSAHVIRSCLANVPELALTAGEQRRDFIFIDDAVDAYALLLDRASALDGGFQEYSLGSGTAVTIRDFVERVHRLTGSRTQLRFGAIPYREHEVMHSAADTGRLHALGWQPRHPLDAGLQKTIDEERHL